MAASTPQGSVRQRHVPGKKKDPAATGSGPDDLDTLAAAVAASSPGKKTGGAQREYQLVGFLITALAILTRFWGISHPDEVVFDEVHFGKVSLVSCLSRPLGIYLVKRPSISHPSSSHS